MKRLNFRLLRLFTAFFLVITTTFSSALPSDRDQPIHVSADSAIKNTKKGFTIYKGNVVITQGSIHLSGDKISIYHKNNTISKIEAKGQPARFKHKPNINSGDIIANGDTIVYDVNKETILLTGNALLKQDDRTTNSNRIIYDIKTEILTAGDHSDRVNMVIDPTLSNP